MLKQTQTTNNKNKELIGINPNHIETYFKAKNLLNKAIKSWESFNTEKENKKDYSRFYYTKMENLLTEKFLNHKNPVTNAKIKGLNFDYPGLHPTFTIIWNDNNSIESYELNTFFKELNGFWKR